MQTQTISDVLSHAVSDAPRHIVTRAPTGLRRLSLAMLATARTAEGFTGLPEGEGTPGKVLAAFKGAAPYLGLAPRLVHAIDWLFKFTQPQDWAPGSRPIVWPSAAMQREALGLEATQVKALNRLLIERGLVVMKDSPNGKRYGKRDRQGRLVEAYGFDLSPLAARQAEFLALAEQGRATRDQMRRLRRRATIARNGLLQIVETVAELGLEDAAWQRVAEEGRGLARALQKVERVDAMTTGVEALERRQREARERLESLIPQVPDAAKSPRFSEDSDPKGAENRPHIITTNQLLYPEQDTVMASKRCREGGAAASPIPPPRPGLSSPSPHNQPPQIPEGPQEWGAARPARTDDGAVLRLNTEELVRLAPQLRPYLRTPNPTWPEIVEAAAWLRVDLGVSKPLWGEACVAMGREAAAIALAIVAAKPAAHFTSSPGGYFHGMVVKAKRGELNLVRTIWGLRRGFEPSGEGVPSRIDPRPGSRSVTGG